MAEGLPIERLRQFLRELKPEARAMLVAELERSLLRGEEMPGADLILAELRRDARDARRPTPRIGNLARLFFQPLEPFLVDDVATHKHPGRIARVALEPIWHWVCRDLLPAEAKVATDEVARAYAGHDSDKAAALARAFQDRTVGKMQAALQLAQSDEKAGRRLSVQIASPRAFEDAQSVLCVLERRDTLDLIARRLPRHIASLEDARRDDIKIFVDATEAEPTLFLYTLLLVMSRLASPWQLIRLGVKAAANNATAAIAETPYAVTIDIILAEVQRLTTELKGELRSGGAVAIGALVKNAHDALRGLRNELQFNDDRGWEDQLTAIRAEITQLLKSEIESMPGRVRRLLRHRPDKEIASGSTLNPGDVDDAEALIAFSAVCQPYAQELGVQEIVERAQTALKQYLEASPQALMESVRDAGETDRRFRQSQLDAAMRFCAKVFGDDYVARLRKMERRNPVAAAG